MKRRIPLRPALALAAAALLAGCASLGADGGTAPVERAVRDRLGAELRADRSDADREHIERRVAELLAAPLSADAAVQIALLNQRGLQARLAALGVSDADRVLASRLPNPGFSFARLRRGDEIELERGLHLSLLHLLLLPQRAALASRQFERDRLGTLQAVLAQAFEARRAWVQAVAAEERVRYRRRVMQAAEASAELARRMEQVGNFSKLQRAREQGFYADAALNLARAEQQRLGTREQLIRRLGLWGAQTGFTLPERLPDLPAEPADAPDIERRAMAERLDVQAARAAAEQTARQLGLTRSTRWVNVLEFGLARNGSNEAPTQRGWEIGFELPLFDSGDARLARAEGLYRQSLHQAAETAVSARSEVRQAYGAWRAAYEIARHHRDEIVPLRARIAEENVLRYNGMLIGVFELLADARAQIASVDAAIEALRDFWLAQADMDRALIGPTTMTPAAGASTAVEAGGGH